MKYLSIILLLTLSSCATYTVVEMHSTNSSLNQKSPIFENDTLIIKYNFWAEDGACTFTFTNKLNIPLYIDWKKCTFFIANGGFPYWKDEDRVSSVGVANSYTSPANSVFRGNTSTGSVSAAVISHRERVTFIAPKSSYTYFGNSLRAYTFPDYLGKYTQLDSVVAKDNKISVTNFQQNNSPWAIRNFLTFSVHENFDSEFYIDNRFFLGKLMEMKKSLFHKETDQKDKDGYYTYSSPFAMNRNFYFKNNRDQYSKH